MSGSSSEAFIIKVQFSFGRSITGRCVHPIPRISAITYLPKEWSWFWRRLRRYDAVGWRHHLHHKDRRLFARAKRAGDLVLYRRQAAQIGDDRRDVRFGQPGEGTPRHDRRENTPVGAHPGRERGGDLRVRPRAQAGFLIGGEVWPDKNTQIGDFEPDIGPAEIARHVRFAKEIAGRMTIEAATDA